jgi:hypothetical protein
MKEQSFANHAQYVPLFHFGLFGLRVIAFFGSIYALYRAIDRGNGRLVGGLLVIMSFAAILQFFFSRNFPLKAQDRAIRAEENLRCFALTGKLLDPRLSMGQIIALRFAPDAEFPALASRAASESMAPKDIKQSVKNWRPDFNRV